MTYIKDQLKLNCGATLPNRLVMAPMVAQGSTVEGFVTQEDLDYFDVRSNVAGMIITGAAAVEDGGRGFDRQIGVSSDAHVEGLTKLASTIKKDGNKAIMQAVSRWVREAVGGYNLFNEVVAPSAIDFPFLPYVPRELTEADILRIIKSFGEATKRAIDSGFDGVEIHGANHYLLQQFFSKYSNRRTDQWGGSLENRMRFSLEVLKEVKSVVKSHAKDDFIVGFRFCPEEIHGENIGFTLEDSIAWMDHVVEYGVDYIHVSIFTGFSDKATGSNVSYGETFKSRFEDKTAVIIVSNVFNLEDANNALKHGDLVAIGRGALVEPDFAGKIMRDEQDLIVEKVTNENFKDLKWPEGLTAWFNEEDNPLPPVPGFSDL